MRKLMFAAAAALMGCKADYVGEGSIKAAQAAIDGKAATMTGVIGIETGSDTKCRELAPSLAEALATEYAGATFIGCTRRNFDNFADFRVALPVLPANTKSGPPLSMRTSLADDTVMVGLYLDLDAVERLRAELPDDVTLFASGPIDIAVTVDVRNDTDAQVSVTTNGAFVDGQPMPNRRVHDLASGAIIRIQPSNVHAAALANGQGAFLFSFDR
ncbi:DUF7424 family protein [Tabrizicola flagellatus]|uniref:DUF7424 family protein n=1 Tax=Tabrizicola flagellatus TaxID=2593021 RepID=UPI0011F2DFFB|nr:hypothetical protein [Tabrizicola flagellatus]